MTYVFYGSRFKRPFDDIDPAVSLKPPACILYNSKKSNLLKLVRKYLYVSYFYFFYFIPYFMSMLQQTLESRQSDKSNLSTASQFQTLKKFA